MACKLVVRRFTAHQDYIGDVVNAYPMEKYLGNLVEPQGGAFVIIEVSDADFDDLIIQGLIEEDLTDSQFNKCKFLQPVSEGDEFFHELLTVGRINITLDRLTPYIRDHINA